MGKSDQVCGQGQGIEAGHWVLVLGLDEGSILLLFFSPCICHVLALGIFNLNCSIQYLQLLAWGLLVPACGIWFPDWWLDLGPWEFEVLPAVRKFQRRTFFLNWPPDILGEYRGSIIFLSA